MTRKPIATALLIIAAALLFGVAGIWLAGGWREVPLLAEPSPTLTHTPLPTRTPFFTRTPAPTRTPTWLPVSVLEFSGLAWRVKTGPGPADPADSTPNQFSNHPQDVYVDSLGWLHLHINQRGGQWAGAEVISAGDYGYGTYTFQLARGIDYDPNVVLSLFTRDESAPQQAYRQIALEFSQFGQPAQTNAAYTIQPWQTPGNRTLFTLTLQPGSSTHSFTWLPDRVHFMSRQQAALLNSLNYRGADIPPAEGSSREVHISLRLLNPPGDGQPVEAVIQSFKYAPYEPTPTPTVPPSATPTSTRSVLGGTPIPPGCVPAIRFTSVPPIGSENDLYGRVLCVDPFQYKVVVYIQVEDSWWIKPTLSGPLTSIAFNSTWVCDITTGDGDINAGRIAAYLLPNGVIPPLLAGASALPDWDYPSVMVER